MEKYKESRAGGFGLPFSLRCCIVSEYDKKVWILYVGSLPREDPSDISLK